MPMYTNGQGKPEATWQRSLAGEGQQPYAPDEYRADRKQVGPKPDLRGRGRE